jgi:ABC-2 type transport system ATP-binding protein
MNQTVLKTTNLTKNYGNGKGAIEINIELFKGEIVGFLGPNGAGKTTTIKLIMDFVKADKGTVELFGELMDSEEKRLACIDKIGFLPGDPSFYDMKVDQVLKYSARLSDLKETKVDELAKRYELDTSKKFSELSLGNKKKVGIVNCFLNDPTLLIMDEPSNSLDPIIQSRLFEDIQAVKDAGGTVLLSSHILNEVEKIADKIIMIKDARIVTTATRKEVLSNDSRKFLVEDISKDLFIKLSNSKDVFNIKHLGAGDYEFLTKDAEKIIKLFVESSYYNFFVSKLTLEEIFLKNYINE